MKPIRFLIWTFLWFVAFVCAAWATGALYFDFPFPSLRAPIAIALVTALLLVLFFVRGQARKLAVFLGTFLIVVFWWLTLKPTKDANWQPDLAETAFAELDGDSVTIHNVRNCDYRTETDFTPKWETRTVRLSQLTGMDMAITYWGSEWMAHPIVSFRFADSLPLCFSIETRKTVGQEYSAVRGFYRQFTLIYIVADERDPIRLRTNYRKGEEVYLYRITGSLEEARERFREYLNTVNELHNKPRWYNAVTTNCTTAIRTQHPVNQRTPWDWRILLNGKGDELLFERHLIATGGLSFPELKEQSHINSRAREADADPDFSRRIRAGLPGFVGEADPQP